MNSKFIWFLFISFGICWAESDKQLTIHIIPFSYNEVFKSKGPEDYYNANVNATFYSVNKAIYNDFLNSKNPKNRTFHVDNMKYFFRYKDECKNLTRQDKKIFGKLTGYQILEQNFINGRFVLTNGGSVMADDLLISHKEHMLSYKSNWNKLFDFYQEFENFDENDKTDQFDPFSRRPKIAWQVPSGSVSC